MNINITSRTKTINAKLLLAIAVLLFVTWPASDAQLFKDTTIVKPLPRIMQWVDNDNYLLTKYNKEQRKDENFIVSIKNGEIKEYHNYKTSTAAKVEVKDGDIYLVTSEGRKQLTNTDDEEKLPVFSPNSEWVAFVRNNDLYALEVSSGKEIRFTSDGGEDFLNGYASYVYYEEILRRNSNYCAFWWSPDSRNIAFFHFDEREVPIFPVYNSAGKHGFIEKIRYPKAGDPNPKLKVGIASIEKSTVVWADFDENVDQYFGKPIWRHDGSSLLVQWMPREQNNLKLFDVNIVSGGTKEIFNEEQATWINWIDRFQWVKDGFLMVRDFDGWEQIYYHDANGKLKRKLTTGKNWRTNIERIDVKNQTLYYSSNAENSTRKDLYSVRLDGSQQRRITFGDYSFDNFLISPDYKQLITTFSNSQTPPQIALINIKNGKNKILADSKGSAFGSVDIGKREIVWLTTEDGLTLPGRITWPEKMEENKKYPVVVNIYGAPNYQAISDIWIMPMNTDYEEPIIRVAFAHRGAGDLGKTGLNYMHRNLGKWEMNDYMEWAKWLITIPSVDPEKVMITGSSYGGYLTLLALTYGAKYFKYGISDFPVTDWNLYDTHYTERYMDLPGDNPEGYKFGSVMTHINNYQEFGPSMLLLQHGAMDINAHAQNSYQLADALQRLNKPFEFMIYPSERHSWLGPKSRFTVQQRKIFQNKYLFNTNK